MIPGTRHHSRKTRHHRCAECTSLWNVKSSTVARKVVRHVSGRRRCIRRNAGHDSRRLWTSEAAQTAAASASEPSVETPGQAAGGPAPSSSSGPAPAAGGPAPEDVNMGAAESSAAQPTSSVVRTLETEDDGSAKRQRLMAGMPILHETDVDVNVDAHKMVVLAAMPDDQGQWTQRVIDWDKKYYGAKSGTLLDTQKVYEGRLRELANIEKLEVAEPIQLQEARAQSLEIVYGKWLDDAKGTPEDPDAVRSRLVATQVNTYVREDVTQATPPIKASKNHCESSCNENKCEGPARLFDW